GHFVQLGADFVPLGRVAGHGAGNGAIDHTVLQGRNHFTEWDGYAVAAQSLNEFSLCTAAGTHFLAFQIAQAVEVAVAKQNLGRVGGKAQYLDVVFGVELFVSRGEGVGQLLGHFDIGSQASQVDGFVNGVVAGEVSQGSRTKGNHALTVQAHDFRTFQAHVVKALDISGDLATGQLRHFLGPEGLLGVLVGGQVAQATDNFQRSLGQFLGHGSRAQGQRAQSQGGQYDFFHKVLLIAVQDRKSTRLNSSHVKISYA